MALSRLLRCCSKTGILHLRCSYTYLFHETKWMPREFKCETASGEVRGIRRRKGAGFSSEIEIRDISTKSITSWNVARGLASRLRLKCGHLCRCRDTRGGRKGAGFSSEIEISPVLCLLHWRGRRKGAGFSSEIPVKIRGEGEQGKQGARK